MLGEINLPPKASATEDPPELRDAILPRLAKATTLTVPTVVMRARSIDQASDGIPPCHEDRRKQGEDRHDDAHHRHQKVKDESPRLGSGLVLLLEEIHQSGG